MLAHAFDGTCGIDWHRIWESVGTQPEVAEIKEKLASFVNSVREEAEAIYQDKFQKDEFPAGAKRKLAKAARVILDDFCPGSCVHHASRMLIRQLAEYQYDSLVLAYGFENSANKVGTRFAVAANDAIMKAGIAAGEDPITFGDILEKYKELQISVCELAEQRHEQLEKIRRQDANHAAMTAYHRAVAPAAATAYRPAAPAGPPAGGEFCG